jgi:hypothetical protein
LFGKEQHIERLQKLAEMISFSNSMQKNVILVIAQCFANPAQNCAGTNEGHPNDV